MEIRTQEIRDAEAFRSLRLQGLREEPTAFGSSAGEEMTLEAGRIALSDSDNLVVIGAFDGSSLIGTVGVMRERGAKYAHKAIVWGMYVAAVGRGHGLGRQLIAEAVAVARAMNAIEYMTLTVNAGNAPAIAIYESAGFVQYGFESRAMRVGEDFYDEILMRMSI